LLWVDPGGENRRVDLRPDLFLGAFSLISALTGRRPWFLLPVLAMVAYGLDILHGVFQLLPLDRPVLLDARGLLRWRKWWKLLAAPLGMLTYVAHPLDRSGSWGPPLISPLLRPRIAGCGWPCWGCRRRRHFGPPLSSNPLRNFLPGFPAGLRDERLGPDRPEDGLPICWRSSWKSSA